MRCVSCGEVHWNLRLTARPDQVQECRLCGAELRPERRRSLRRFDRLRSEARDRVSPAESAKLGPRASS